MITDKEYLDIINEAYDLSDSFTQKNVIFCNEAQKNANISHITERLYQHIKDNTTDIDFGTIPKSKGVVTKVENYQKIVDCLDVINKLVLEYHESTEIVDQVSTALDNVQRRERIFNKAFAMNIEFPRLVYNTTVLAVISSVSLLITTCIEYVKNGDGTFSMAFDKTRYAKSKNHVLYLELVDFNQICADGSLDKMMNQCIKNNLVATNEGFADVVDVAKTFAGSAGGVVAIVIGVGASIIFFLKLLKRAIYYWKYCQVKLSDWFAVQSEFLNINAENLKYRDDERGEEHRNKVYDRQIKWVQILKKISNDLALKDKKAQKYSDDEDRADEKQRYEEPIAQPADGSLF